jgi:hypothetical protein
LPLYSALRLFITSLVPGLRWTTVQVNKNFHTGLHDHPKNAGPGVITSFGNYTGGGFSCGNKTFNLKSNLVQFDGRHSHGACEFTGERYTVVFYPHESCIGLLGSARCPCLATDIAKRAAALSSIVFKAFNDECLDALVPSR